MTSPSNESAFPGAIEEEPPQARYINRELSWLAFNHRVLEEAANPAVPLLERLRFLSICAANLDEFFMVRVAGVKDQIDHHVQSYSMDGLSPQEQLKAIAVRAKALIEAQQQCWLQLQTELKAEGIEQIAPDALSKDDMVWLRRHFRSHIFPLLTPIAVDPSHPFPFIPNLGMACLFELQPIGSVKKHVALLSLPPKLSRFVFLPARADMPTRFMSVEQVIHRCFDILFPGFEAMEMSVFRIIRDSDLDIQEEAEDLMRTFEKAVKERRRGRVVRVKVEQNLSRKMRQFLLKNLHVEEEDVFEVAGMIGVANLSELYELPRDELKFPPFQVRFPERINDYRGDCFAAIQAKDIVVHHPYESFDVVVQFIRQAAYDPDVVSIKQTLYRTSHDSPIVRALIEAAERGKSVTALVELKARFDEEANIRWARDMERVGIQVVYGFVKLKTHAKISLVVRREKGRLRSYAHFGTGNYHPTTAKIYTDLSFFTCNRLLCRDAAHLFNYITGYARPKGLKKLAIAPLNLRSRLVELIDAEIKAAKEGRPSGIWAKMNSLIDAAMIDKLYAASQAGVPIDLVVRGICGLRPGIAGLSDNIRVKSVVGRFLEHSRIYCFANGAALPSPQAVVYIASADWMTRNFDYRVEAMIPIENPTVHAQILDQIMIANLNDTAQSWMLQLDGSYQRIMPVGTPFSAHDYFMNNPSLSGRGKALSKQARQLMSRRSGV